MSKYESHQCGKYVKKDEERMRWKELERSYGEYFFSVNLSASHYSKALPLKIQSSCT
jgi:hypothetical protein